jgi:hypothetical protein
MPDFFSQHEDKESLPGFTVTTTTRETGQHQPGTVVESKGSIIGGLLGAVGGWFVLVLSIMGCGSLIGTKNPLLMLVGIVWSILNLIGFVACPIIGFSLGYNFMFTTKRQTF